MKDIKNKATAALADDFISAAQVLEKMARRLKDDARVIRREGLYALRPDQPEYAIHNQRMHKHYDIKHAAAHAMEAIQYTERTDAELRAMAATQATADTVHPFVAEQREPRRVFRHEDDEVAHCVTCGQAEDRPVHRVAGQS